MYFGLLKSENQNQSPWKNPWKVLEFDYVFYATLNMFLYSE